MDKLDKLDKLPLGTAGCIVILLLVLVSIFADSLAPYRFEEIHLRDRLQAPSVQYLLGTDHVGRDLPDDVEIEREIVALKAEIAGG